MAIQMANAQIQKCYAGDFAQLLSGNFQQLPIFQSIRCQIIWPSKCGSFSVTCRRCQIPHFTLVLSLKLATDLLSEPLLLVCRGRGQNSVPVILQSETSVSLCVSWRKKRPPQLKFCKADNSTWVSHSVLDEPTSLHFGPKLCETGSGCSTKKRLQTPLARRTQCRRVHWTSTAKQTGSLSLCSSTLSHSMMRSWLVNHAQWSSFTLRSLSFRKTEPKLATSSKTK